VCPTVALEARGPATGLWPAFERVPTLLLAPSAACAGVALSIVLAPELEGGYLLFPVAAAAIVSLVRGARAGTLTSVASFVLLAWAFHSAAGLAPPQTRPDLRLLFFAAVSIPVVAVSDGLRRTFRRVEQRRAAAAAREQEWAALATFGRRALATAGVEPLLADAVRTVGEALHADLARFVPAPEGGAGLPAAEWGSAPRTEHLRRVRAHVRLGTGRAAPCGTIEVYARGRLRFRVEEVRFLQTFATVVGAAIQHVQAQAHVQAKLEFSRAVTNHLAEGVCALDAAGRTTFVNPAAETLLGWSEAEILGRPFHEVVHPRRDGSEPFPITAALAPERMGEDQEDTFVRKDGAALTVAWRAAPIEAGGERQGTVVSFRDLTGALRARHAERLLAEAGRVLAETLDEGPTLARIARLIVPDMADWCMVVAVERSGELRRVAIEAADPARLEAARELLGNYPIDVGAAHGVGRVLRTGEPELLTDARGFIEEGERTAPYRRALLERIGGLTSFIGVPLRARGRLLGVLDFATSESGRRYGPEDLALALALAERCAFAIDNARLYREAREATAARDDVLSIVSHDLKNPIAAIKAGAGALARTAAPGSIQARVSHTLLRASDRMTRLVSDLVDLASLDAGRLSMQLQPIDAAEVAAEVVQALATVAEEEGVALRLEPLAGAAPALADRERMAQVLSNLVGNAIKATPDGGEIRVRVEARPRSALLLVADTGRGIAPEDLPHVFERYYRGSPARYAGQGLGLAIAKRIVDAHGGRIWVESEVGRGSTFAVEIPAPEGDTALAQHG